MGRLIRTAAGLVFLLFLLATAWGVTFTGVFEEARADVPHFEAGAGNLLLLVRGGLAILSALLLLLAAITVRGRFGKVVAVLGALVAIPLFLWSCLGFERWAPGYSERGFDAIYARYDRHEPVSAAEVTAVLGPPLFTSSVLRGEVAWHYSYMPSGGFGWHKRIIWFQHGWVSSMVAFEEP